MLADYLHWQYTVAPRWLLTLTWNLQRAITQFFSVGYMLRTLLAHWHRDVVPYHGGSLSNLGLSFTWNMISRGIGFLIRSSVLAIWLAVEATFLPFALFIIALFLLWPLLVPFLFLAGIVVMFM